MPAPQYNPKKPRRSSKSIRSGRRRCFVARSNAARTSSPSTHSQLNEDHGLSGQVAARERIEDCHRAKEWPGAAPSSSSEFNIVPVSIGQLILIIPSVTGIPALKKSKPSMTHNIGLIRDFNGTLWPLMTMQILLFSGEFYDHVLTFYKLDIFFKRV